MSDTPAPRVETPAASALARRWAKPPFGPRTLLILFVLANLILCALPLVPQLFGHGKGKDYPLWYHVGRLVLSGGDLYPKTGQIFGFLYPPFAAVLLTPFSLLGPAVSILCIDLGNVASWFAAVKFSERLAGGAANKPWWVVALPSVLALPFIWDMYDLGQPNLLLLAIVLGGLVLLQGGREWSAGALFAAAAALKAFPVAIFPYLIWRRRWRAAASMAVMIGVCLLLIPAPFRGFTRNLDEVKTWAGGMVFSASEKGFGQRPEQNWGWKNNSIIAVTHRYVRPINAEAEKPDARPLYVNFLDLTYDQANVILAVVAGLVGLSFVAVLPPRTRRTTASDGAEYALLIALMTITSPLARAYYFVWLLFPFTLMVFRAASDADPKTRRVAGWSLVASIGLFTAGVAVASPHILPALGNMFWATAILIVALGWIMRRQMSPPSPSRGGTDREAVRVGVSDAATDLP